jgi:hypothetical protein
MSSLTTHAAVEKQNDQPVTRAFLLSPFFHMGEMIKVETDFKLVRLLIASYFPVATLVFQEFVLNFNIHSPGEIFKLYQTLPRWTFTS